MHCLGVKISNKVDQLCSRHRNKKCIEVATEEFLKGRPVLLLEIERPLSISHVFSKQSVFHFIKLSALFFSPLMLYFIFNPSLLFLPVFGGQISFYHVFLFLTVFWPLHGEQCCTFYTIDISMAPDQLNLSMEHSQQLLGIRSKSDIWLSTLLGIYEVLLSATFNLQMSHLQLSCYH